MNTAPPSRLIILMLVHAALICSFDEEARWSHLFIYFITLSPRRMPRTLNFFHAVRKRRRNRVTFYRSFHAPPIYDVDDAA